MTTLAISVSISGDYSIVGAYGEDEDASGANTQTSAGSAYIFSLKPAHELSGSLYHETGTNCAFDTTTENPLKGQIVKATPQGSSSSFYTVSNDDGSYKLYVPLPDTATVYTIEAVSDTLGILQASANCPPFTITLTLAKSIQPASTLVMMLRPAITSQSASLLPVAGIVLETRLPSITITSVL